MTGPAGKAVNSPTGRPSGWIDIHTHILPGFDDGASDDDEFLAMARTAAGSGTSVAAATPHFDLDASTFRTEDVSAETTRCNSLLAECGIPLIIVRGLEVRISAGLLELARSGTGLEELCLGEGGRCMLVELPFGDVPMVTGDVFFNLRLQGILPVLAHPERNRYLLKHASVVRGFVDQGVELQVNSGSIDGAFGRAALRFARRLLKEGAAGLVATDAHGPRSRKPDLSGTAPVLDRLLGEGAARRILEVNPRRILDGEKTKSPS